MKHTAMLCLAFLALTGCSSSVSSAQQEEGLTAPDKQHLLDLARWTLYWYLKDGVVPKPVESQLSRSLRQKRACFVTLKHRKYDLRGCMGMFEPTKPLYVNVISRAIAAATRDPRFPRVRYGELKDIKLDISVLTVPKRLDFDSPEDLLAKLRPNVDGVLLETRYGGSTYLPQVWEHFAKKEDFLSRLCKKHRAPADTWRTDYKNVKVSTYQAVVFGEEVYGRKVVGKDGATVGKRGATLLGTMDPRLRAQHTKATKAPEGSKLGPGTILSPDSDIIED